MCVAYPMQVTAVAGDHGQVALGDAVQEVQAWLSRQPAGSKARQLGQLYEAYRRRLGSAVTADARDVNAAVLPEGSRQSGRGLRRRGREHPGPGPAGPDDQAR